MAKRIERVIPITTPGGQRGRLSVTMDLVGRNPIYQLDVFQDGGWVPGTPGLILPALKQALIKLIRQELANLAKQRRTGELMDHAAGAHFIRQRIPGFHKTRIRVRPGSGTRCPWEVDFQTRQKGEDWKYGPSDRRIQALREAVEYTVLRQFWLRTAA